MLKKDKSEFTKLAYIFSIITMLGLSIPTLSEASGAHNANIAEEEITAWEEQEHIENSDILGPNTSKQAQDILSSHLTDGAYQPLTNANIRIAREEVDTKLKNSTSESETNNLKADLKILENIYNTLPNRTWNDTWYSMGFKSASRAYGEAKKRPSRSVFIGPKKQKHYLQNFNNKLHITNVSKSMDALND